MGAWTPTALWAAVFASGLYHGLSPGMGWPLAVSAGLMERSPRALIAAFGPLTLGHMLAMLVLLLPFSLLIALLEWQREVQIAASMFVIAFGMFRFMNGRHPRLLARIKPTQLALWSFAVAIAHGAGLMLVPSISVSAVLPISIPDMRRGALIAADLGMAIIVSAVHSLVMIAAGGCLAWLVYQYFGLKLVSRSWFNLDRVGPSLLFHRRRFSCPTHNKLTRVHT